MIINKNIKRVELDLNRFEEIDLDQHSLKNIISDEEITWNSPFVILEKGVILLTTKM